MDICTGDSTNPCSSYANCESKGRNFTCSCRAGFSDLASGTGAILGRPGNCKDVNECTQKPNPCGDQTLLADTKARTQATVCQNEMGFAKCLCPQGYRIHTGKRRTALTTAVLSPANVSDLFANAFCQDVDECAAENRFKYPCPQHSACINTLGGHKCVCKPGYERAASVASSYICQNINECKRDAPCGVRAKCQDKQGFSTVYPKGYVYTTFGPHHYVALLATVVFL